MRTLLVCAALLAMEGGIAFAQDRPPIEVGLGISSFGAGSSYEDVSPPRGQAAPDVRVTFPLSPRFSVEEMVTFVRGERYQSPAYQTRREGLLFATQVNQRIEKWTRGGFHPFLLYGAAVYSEKERVDFAAPARSSAGVVTSVTYDRQGMYGVFGVGVQQQIGRHVAVRAETTVLAFLAGNIRASVGVSIPLGSYK